MNLDPTPDQELLRNTFETFFRKESPIDRVRALLAGGGFDEILWRRLVELGGDVIAIGEAAGGGGGTLVDAVLVCLEAGRCLATVPLAETAAALRAVARGAPDPVRRLDGSPWTVATSAGAGPSWVAWGAIAESALVVTAAGALAIVRRQDGSGGCALDNLGGLPAATINTDDPARHAAQWTPVEGELETLDAEVRLLYAAELVGCGRGALDLAIGHVTERRQFGQPVGSFQALQHRLVDCLIRLDAAELMAIRAVCYEGEGAEFRRRCVAAALRAATAAEQAAAEALQFFGGYGFALDCDVHLFLRFAKARAVMVREGVRHEAARGAARDAVARSGLDFRRGADEEDFATEVRAFLATHLTDDLQATVQRTGGGFDLAFHRAMAARGWILAALPQENGGLGLPPAKIAVLWEELYYAEAPVASQQLTETVASIVALRGTDEQRESVVGPVLRGELLCAIAYTEPDAGSDVASVTTRAERVDGGYLVNGTKMFTTMAQVADYVFLLARTDSELPKHRGLSTFLIPLRHPGIEIRALETLGGERTNITVYEDVFVPDQWRIGDENDGWAVLNAGLAIERASLAGFVGRARRVLDDLTTALGDPEPAPPELVEAWVAIEAAAVLCDRVNCRLAAGGVSDVEAAIAKIAATEAFKDLARLSLDLVGTRALMAGKEAVAGGNLERLYRSAQVATIYAGTSEVLRNMIAIRGLGLPR